MTYAGYGGGMRCARHMRRGWWCSRRLLHDGPCALRPHWWNITPDAVAYRLSARTR